MDVVLRDVPMAPAGHLTCALHRWVTPCGWCGYWGRLCLHRVVRMRRWWRWLGVMQPQDLETWDPVARFKSNADPVRW